MTMTKSNAENDPRIWNFKQVNKSVERTPTLEEIRHQQKQLNARLRAQSARILASLKDATEAAEAAAVNTLMELADRLQLPEAGVMALVRRYSLAEVQTVLETLSQSKAMKGYMIDPFFDQRTTRIDLAGVEQIVKKQYAKNHPEDSFYS